jgi:hypothetical protein
LGHREALVRRRTRFRHHDVQEHGRDQVLMDYHLRVGRLTADTHLPDGHRLVEQRPDETEVGEGSTVTLIDRDVAARRCRLRQVRVIRDCGVYDRRENPQYHPEVARP